MFDFQIGGREFDACGSPFVFSVVHTMNGRSLPMGTSTRAELKRGLGGPMQTMHRAKPEIRHFFFSHLPFPRCCSGTDLWL